MTRKCFRYPRAMSNNAHDHHPMTQPFLGDYDDVQVYKRSNCGDCDSNIRMENAARRLRRNVSTDEEDEAASNVSTRPPVSSTSMDLDGDGM